MQQLESLIVLAERPTHVDEMRRNLGILLEPIRALEVVARAAVVAELVEHPTHAVDDRRAVGVQRERLLDVAARLFVPVELIRQEIAERVQNGRVVGRVFREALQHVDGSFVLALVLEQQRLRVAQRRLAGIALQALAQHRVGLVERLPVDRVLHEQDVELDVCRAQGRVVGRSGERFVEELHGLLRLLHLQQQLRLRHEHAG